MKLGRIWMIAALAACGGGSTNNNAQDGALNGHCYPNNTCNAGLTCSGGVCEMGIELDAAVHGDSNVVIVDGPGNDGNIGHPDSSVLPDAAVPDAGPGSDGGKVSEC